MTQSDWASLVDSVVYARVKELFAEVLELCPGEREEMLRRLHGSQEVEEEVLAEVESLLAYTREPERGEP